MTTQCPTLTSNNCTHPDVSIENSPVSSYVASVSSGFSCLGSILIVVTFYAVKHMRTGTRKIITFLALADFVSAAGYIVGSVNFLMHYNKTESKECQVFEDIICVAQATITSWSSLVSLLWTAILYNRLLLPHLCLPLYFFTGCLPTQASLSHCSLGVPFIHRHTSSGYWPFGLCILCCCKLVFSEKHWFWTWFEGNKDHHYSFQRKVVGAVSIHDNQYPFHPCDLVCCKGMPTHTGYVLYREF